VSVLSHQSEGFIFTNRPVPAELSRYEAARNSLIDYLSIRDDVVALFEYGEVAAPGLSDLDFVVVLKDPPAVDIDHHLDRARLPVSALRAMSGATLMVMSEEHFADITRWDDLRLVNRFGRHIEAVRLEGRAQFLTEVCRIVDWLPWQLARLTRVIVKRQMPVATTIAWLYSLTYSLRKVETVLGASDDRWRTFREEIVDFRHRFFDNPEGLDERLVSLTLEGHAVGCDALRAFGEDIVAGSGMYGPVRAPEGRLVVPGGVVLDFVARHGVPTPGDLVSGSTDDTTVVTLPAGLIRHFAVYASSDGLISRRLRAALTPPTATSESSHVAADMREILHARIAACDRWASFLRDIGMRSGLFKFAWFFENERSAGDVKRTPR
jgi:hypothetical protein